ncbi:MAG: hypothetical protein PSV16_14610 [Flavobacterium sp.]|nr:hypothetical protein [Flavobacterium sp.]
MYAQLRASIAQTGDKGHADTQQKEMNYKKTLSIAELRDYQDNKPDSAAKPAASQQPAANAPATAAPAIAKTTVETKTAASTTPQAEKSAENPAAPQEAVDTTPKTAAANPAFAGLTTQVGATAKAQKHHEAATKSSHDAQEAAPSPSNERESKAQAGQVDNMDAQKPGTFSAEDFRVQLKKKIEGMTLPTDEKEADNFESHNNIKEVNDGAINDVKSEKNAATGAIATATSQKPNTNAQPVRTATPLPQPAHGKAPAVVNAAKAMPVKRDAAVIEQPVKAQTNELDDRMKENGVTDNMLAKSNEPSFTNALDQKNNAKTQSKAATTQFRQNEGGQLAQTRSGAQEAATAQIGGMFAGRKAGLNKAHGNQKETADKDNKARKEVADRVNGIFAKTQTDVNAILKNLDGTVAKLFDDGSKASKIAFEKHVQDNMRAYKKKRYGDAYKSYGALATAGLWLWDKATGLPDEVNEFFVSGKQKYIDTMDGYIIKISNLVANELNAAKARIAAGRKEVQQYITGLSPALRKLGKDAINAIQGKFSELEETVNAKKDALIDTLAKKYADNVAAIDKRIEDLKAANSGFINQALGALAGVFAFIIDMKNKLLSLLSKVADVIMAIITDPIGFFSNLIAGVGQGFSNFTANIWTHLKTGFFGWLTGAMKGISFTMPEDAFSIKGVFSIAMQVLGIGWEGIRAIGATVLGEPVIKALETGLEVVQIIRKDGIAGLWEYLKDQFQDLKATVMDAIMDIIQNQVIQAGIKWILGLLSPVGAFMKALMAIVDVVKFFIQRAAQIMDLIDAFMESVAAIAGGKVGAVAKSIENALAKSIPVLIGLLASILGISGLADKVLGVIKKIRDRITKGITKFWNFVKEKGKALLGKVGIGGKKDKQKVDDKHLKNMDTEIAPETFTMNGKTHTLTFEKDEIYMSSDKGTLTRKLSTFRKYVNDKSNEGHFEVKNDVISNELATLEGRNDKVRKDLRNVVKRKDSPTKASDTTKAQQELDQLGADIHKFGDTHKMGDLEASKKGDHKKYKPEKIDLFADNKQIKVKYSYEVEVDGKKEKRTFENSLRLVDINSKLIEQKAKGYNLVTKETGTRGKTASANQVATNEAIKGLKKDPEQNIEFNASHMIADQFLGSGYKDTLNLVTASGPYNKEIMRGAEETLLDSLNDIEKVYKRKNIQNYITFDIIVTAQLKELTDNGMSGILEKLNPNTEKGMLESLHKTLATKTDPKLIESMTYMVSKVKLNGSQEIEHNIDLIKIGRDETLKQALID